MAADRTEETLHEQVAEVTTCPICQSSFCDPRVLPCSHTFCLQCIKNCASHNHGHFACPLRDGTTVREAHIDSLPINLVIRDIVELIKKRSGEKDPGRT